jgi:uncharacterized membrane protein
VCDWAAEAFGKPWFLAAHLVMWACWIGFSFEAYPYQLLTMILSLEAIVMSILILNSSNRQGDKDRKIIQKDLDLDHATQKTVQKIWEKLNGL